MARPEYIFAVLLLFITAAPAQQTSDYLIFENVQPLVLFNRYEHQLSDREKQSLPPLGAFLIRQDHLILSDNFSAAAEVDLENRTFFLLLDPKGQIRNLELTGSYLILKKTQRLMDTVVVKISDAVSLQNPFTGEKSTTLTKDDMVLRLFRDGNKIYARQLTLPVYGWLETKQKQALEQFLPEDPELILFSESEISQIERSIQRINKQITDIFNLFNQSTGQNRNTPQWVLNRSEDRIECFLNAYTSEFKQTCIALQKEVTGYIRSKNYQVTGTPDHFIIEIKN